jgi:uncharacterized spore protein YtfJ
MSDTLDSLISSVDKNQEQSMKVIEKIFSAAQPGAVFGEPVTAGDYTVITAGEVAAGGGFGTGVGLGPAGSPSSEAISGGGGGAGGGGGSSGRPVAVIIIGPDGVRVKPVVDITKVALALFTTWGAMFLMMRRMRRMSKG